MASQCVLLLSLFLVLVGATMAAIPLPEIHPISDYNSERVQFLGKFAVDQYNKMGESYLFFMQVVNGTVLTVPLNSLKIWDLQLKANNCSEPSSPALYSAQVFENMFKSQITAYNSQFMTFGTVNRA